MRFQGRHAWGAVLIALFALPVLRPEGIPVIERPVADTFAWFGNVPLLNPHLWGSASEPEPGDTTRSEYARGLEQENAVLREEFAQRMRLEEDLAELKGALEGLTSGGLDRLPRVVVARVLRTADAAAYRRSILIDRGAEDGLVRGMAVVSGRVYVGKIEVLHERSALVKLVSDRRSRLEVAVRTTANQRLRGFVRGHGRGTVDDDLDVRFAQVPLQTRVGPDGAGRVLPGAPVFTSNADALVPAALLVGFVTEVSDRDLDGMPRIRIRPALDLGRATRVLVVLPPVGRPP